MMIKYNYIVFVFVFLSIQISEQITNYFKQIISSESAWKKKKKKEAGWIRVFLLNKEKFNKVKCSKSNLANLALDSITQLELICTLLFRLLCYLSCY